LTRWWADPVSRLTLLMSVLFTGWGAAMPFVPVWLEEARGLSGEEIGAILAAAPLGRMIIAPMIAAWADGRKDRRRAYAVLALGATAAYASLLFAHSFWALLAGVFFASIFSSGLGPLLEGATLRRSIGGVIPFGLARAIASGAFVFGSIGAGVAISLFSVQAAVIWLMASHGLTVLTALFLLQPEPAPAAAGGSFANRLLGGFGLFRNPRFALAVFAGAAVQSAHAFYYGFGALTWRGQGVAENLIGLLMSIGVIAEIVFLLFLARIERRISPEMLLALGAAGAVVRWLLMALAPPLAALFALQLLHALSFAAAHIGTLRLVLRETPESSTGLGQTLYSAVSSGLFMGVMTRVSGDLYQHHGAGGYVVMAGLAAIGFGLALLVMRQARTISARTSGGKP
jgi:PPP family 3-phenylpropionic acid transporter